MRHIVKKRGGKAAAAFEIQMCWILKLMYVFIHLRAASMCACVYILSAAMKRCREGLVAHRSPPCAPSSFVSSKLQLLFFFCVVRNMSAKTRAVNRTRGPTSPWRPVLYVNTFTVSANFQPHTSASVWADLLECQQIWWRRRRRSDMQAGVTL